VHFCFPCLEEEKQPPEEIWEHRPVPALECVLPLAFRHKRWETYGILSNIFFHGLFRMINTDKIKYSMRLFFRGALDPEFCKMKSITQDMITMLLDPDTIVKHIFSLIEQHNLEKEENKEQEFLFSKDLCIYALPRRPGLHPQAKEWAQKGLDLRVVDDHYLQDCLNELKY